MALTRTLCISTTDGLTIGKGRRGWEVLGKGAVKRKDGEVFGTGELQGLGTLPQGACSLTLIYI